MEISSQPFSKPESSLSNLSLATDHQGQKCINPRLMMAFNHLSLKSLTSANLHHPRDHHYHQQPRPLSTSPPPGPALSLLS